MQLFRVSKIVFFLLVKLHSTKIELFFCEKDYYRMTLNPMAAVDEELVVKLDTSKPLGFRLYQPVEPTTGKEVNGVSLKIVKVKIK